MIPAPYQSNRLSVISRHRLHYFADLKSDSRNSNKKMIQMTENIVVHLIHQEIKQMKPFYFNHLFDGYLIATDYYQSVIYILTTWQKRKTNC